MATEIEYERTFLAKIIPEEINKARGIPMHDVMVPDTAHHPNLRLRHQGDTFVITKEKPVQNGDATEMSEETIGLTKAEFEALASSSTKDIAKTRYKVEIDGYPAEVDVFGAQLTGLVLIDFEFGSKAERDNFTAPEVCLAEVSQEEFTAGGFLAGKSYEDIESELHKYDYKKI